MEFPAGMAVCCCAAAGDEQAPGRGGQRGWTPGPGVVGSAPTDAVIPGAKPLIALTAYG